MSAQDNTSHGRIGIAAGEIVGGKFQIGPMIGRGGMSVVYEARHVQLGQLVAVKVLSGAQAAGRADFERILVEAQATARLTSEHVVRVMDVGTTGQGKAYVVMEKLVGQDLGEQLKNGARFSTADAVKLVLEACHGIAEAHAAGIVHRDIKPSNLFLVQKPDKTVTLKVLDFGLASATTATQHLASRATPRGARIAGSPGYASPEQLGTTGDADARADIWGLGIVLYELVSGTRPFEAKNLAEALIAAATTPMPPLRSPLGPIPPGFEAVVRKCLEKDRENRYATISDLAEALRPYAPPWFQHYVERVRAVSRIGVSVRMMRVAQPDPSTATIGTFSTDTSTFTQEPPSTMAPPSSLPMPSNPEPSQGPNSLVTASVVPQRALLFAILLLVAGGAVFYVGMTRRVVPRAPTTAATAQPSATPSSLPSATATSVLGPLGPLAALDAGAPAEPTSTPTPATTADKPADSVTVVSPNDLEAPKPDRNNKKRPPKIPPSTPPAPKPSGNPLGYR